MRLLWLTPELPFAPGGTGGATRQFHLLRRLVELGHEAVVVAPVHPTQEEGALRLREVGVDLRGTARPRSRVAETLAAVARRPPLATALLREPVLAWQADVMWTAMRPLVRAELAEQRPDAMLVEHDWAAAWHLDLPPEVPRALTLHNVSWEYYEARARAAGGRRSAALSAEARRFRSYDRRRLPAYDLLLAVSDADRSAVRELVDVPCEVVPNGVDVSDPPTPREAGDRDGRLLLYTGTMTHPPNAEGLEWLLRDVWPRIRAAVPDARLRVVGRGAREAADPPPDDRVEVLGAVPTMEPHYAEADVVLVPILSGGGTRLKVLDAFAAARPVVSTRIGAAGLDAEDRVHLLLADGAEAFAGAVSRVLADPSLAETLATAGRALVEAAYDWRAVGDRLDALLAELVSRPASGARR
jgi:polysaccharide biosynthesis protein PslH